MLTLDLFSSFFQSDHNSSLPLKMTGGLCHEVTILIPKPIMAKVSEQSKKGHWSRDCFAEKKDRMITSHQFKLDQLRQSMFRILLVLKIP